MKKINLLIGLLFVTITLFGQGEYQVKKNKYQDDLYFQQFDKSKSVEYKTKILKGNSRRDNRKLCKKYWIMYKTDYERLLQI